MRSILMMFLVVVALTGVVFGGQSGPSVQVEEGGGDNPYGVGPAAVTNVNSPKVPPSPSIRNRDNPSGGNRGRS